MICVIDTNVALNLWLFKDPITVAALSAHVQPAHCFGTPPMLKELLRVARSGHLQKYAINEQYLDLLEHDWRTHVHCFTDTPMRSPLNCRDPDDQMFLDLAHSIQADCIFTLDRDLLKLKKRAAYLGLTIQPPTSIYLVDKP